MPHLSENYRQFFIDLASNNNSEWFNANRKRYEKDVKIPFTNLVSACLAKISALDPQLKNVTAQECIFRINRDIRFSKDKTPYKMNMSAAFAPGGRKNMCYPGFYFEATPEGITIVCGLYSIEKDQLERLRKHIVQNLDKFETLLKEPYFVKAFGGQILGDKNTRLAPEFKEAAAKQALLFNKQFYLSATLDESFLTHENLEDHFMNYFKIAQPMNQFLNCE